MDDRLVWYVAYGSNLDRARLRAYLRGGPIPGTGAIQRGARDRRDPRRDEPCRLPMRMRFAGWSRRWSGAVAFLEHRRAGAGDGALGRRHLVTAGQLADVVAQESGRPTRPLPLDELEPGVVTAIGDGAYDGVVALDPVDGVAAVTFTSPDPPEAREPAAPSAAYLAVIGRGMAEAHGMSAEAVAGALLEVAGVAPVWSRDRLVTVVTDAIGHRVQGHDRNDPMGS